MYRLASLFMSALSLITFAILPGAVNAQQLVTGLTLEEISITSDFTGAELVVFGTINDMQGPATSGDEEITMDRYEIVVVIEGPREPGVVRKKERVGGIWINQDNVKFDSIPSSYLMMASSPPEEARVNAVLKELKLGAEFTSFGTLRNVFSSQKARDFRGSVVRLKREEGLYHETDGVRFIADNLFRAQFKIPALIPVGTHRVRSFLLFDNKLISKANHEVRIIKTGFEQLMYNFAHENGIAYGICCVLLAIITGWLSSIIFRRG